MKNLIIIISVLSLFWLCSCSRNNIEGDVIKNQNNIIIPIDKNLLNKTDSSIFSVPVVVPIPLLSKDLNLVLYDFADGYLKLFNLNNFERIFNPIQDGPERLRGEYFKGVGFYENSLDSILVGSNKEISSYNFVKEKYNEIPIDFFSHCVSFNDTFQEIFFRRIGEEEIVISQNGFPCYDLAELGELLTIENFKEKFFIRIVSSAREEAIYTLQLPDFVLENLYERFRLVVTYNDINRKFYVMLNPLSYLFVYNLNEETLQMELDDYWEMDLDNNDLPVDYFIEKDINYQIANKSLEYNFELGILDSFGDYVAVSYQPSKELIYDNPLEAPYSSHNFLAIINLKSKEIRTFSLNYDEYQFFGASNGFLWIYDVESSEKSGYTVFRLPLINDLWKE